MNATHTPGPWQAERADHAFEIICKGFIVADVYHEEEAGYRTGPATALEAEANARLIAAAPTMLATLRACLEAMGDYYDCQDAHENGGSLHDLVTSTIQLATNQDE